MLKTLKKFIQKNRVGTVALFLAAAMLLSLLSSSLLVSAQNTHGGICDASCGSSQSCVGVAPGLTCQTGTGSFGVCDSSCTCVVKGLDDNKAACLLKGYKWSSAGETTPFGGFSQVDIDSSKEECVGDDAGEYYRFRECETALCKTDASDNAACKSRYSCVFDKKCFARTDKAVDEVEGVKSEAGKSAGQTDEKSSMLQMLLVLNQKVKTAKTNAEKKAVGRDIASLLRKIERQGGLPGLTVQPLQKLMKKIPRKTATGVLTGNTDNVLCTPSI